MIRLLAERSDTNSNVKLGGCLSQLQASYVSSHTEELGCNETASLWMTLYIYIYIYIYISGGILWRNVRSAELRLRREGVQTPVKL